MLQLMLRAGFYILAIGLGYLVVKAEVMNFHRDEMFTEFGYVELTQAALLLTASIMLALAARSGQYLKQLLVCGSMLMLVLFIRELDQVFEVVLPHGFWKWPALVVVLALGTYFMRNRKEIVDQAVAFSTTFPFGVMLAGFSILLASRWLGQGLIWETIMHGHYDYVVKTAVEEGMELFSLTIITLSCAEMALMVRKGK